VFADFEGWVRLEAFGRTDTRSDLEAVAQLADPSLGLPEFPYHVPGFSVANLRVGLDHENFSINGFVENLFEENYYTSTSENFGLSGMRVRPHPRTFGVRVRVRYGE
jgi:iron complex outermembrane receptor protein